MFRFHRRAIRDATALIALLLAACSPMATPTYFIPPAPGAVPAETPAELLALTPTPRIEPSAPPTEPPSSPTPECSDDLDYVQDLTIPDGSIMAPGATIDKRWQVRNSGSCNWDQRYGLHLISGDAMGAAVDRPLYPARAGTEATLQVLFTAPQDPGTYACQWQAVNPEGTPFGDAFYVQIVVAG